MVTPRVARALTLGVLLAGLAVSPGTASDDPADTQAPLIDLNPCYGEVTSCRLVYADIFGNLEPGDDLAVLGARIGDVVIEEQTYDDGTGFQPYGMFLSYGNDAVISYDFALRIPLAARSTSDITFYAEDLEGNSSELTTTVHGPVPPGPVRKLTATLVEPRTVRLSWTRPNLKGSCCPEYIARTPGREPKTLRSGPPRFHDGPISFAHLSRGWHRFTVKARTEGGDGEPRSVRIFVPRRHHG